MTWVIEDAPKDLKPAETLVALILANHASSDGGHAYPSVQTIMDETRLSRRSVQTALRSLEDRGLIEEERGATRRLPAMYCFPVFRGAISAPHIDSGAQSTQSGAQILHVRGANSAPKPLVEPSVEPLDTPRSPPKEKTKHATSMTEGWQPDGMERWLTENGFTQSEVDRELPNFRDHHINKEPKRDWPAAFRLWMRRSRAWGPRVSANGSNGHHPEADADMAAWLQVVKDKEHEARTGRLPETPTTRAIHYAVKAIGGWGKVDPTNGFQRRDFLAAHKAARQEVSSEAVV